MKAVIYAFAILFCVCAGGENSRVGRIRTINYLGWLPYHFYRAPSTNVYVYRDHVPLAKTASDLGQW